MKVKTELNITKEEFLNADYYIFTINNITQNGITEWNLYLLKNNDFKRVVGGSYWSESKNCYHISAWGLNRAWEILLQIGYSLGLKLEEINQNKMLCL